MRTGPIISLILSVIVGLVAVVFGRSWLDSEAEASLPPGDAAQSIAAPVTTRIMVARNLIERGAGLTEEQVDYLDWPEAFVPAGAVTEFDALVSESGGLAYARGVIVPGEPILSEKLTFQVPRETLASIIEPGFRAVSLEVTDATGVAGFVLPEHRVDVILSRELINPNGSRSFRPETIVENVRVLGVDQTFSSELEGASLARTVTLEVSPEQAGTLTAASDIGRIGLALRSKSEPAITEPKPEPTPVVVRRAPRPRRPTTATVRIIEGEDEETVTTPVASKRD